MTNVRIAVADTSSAAVLVDLPESWAQAKVFNGATTVYFDHHGHTHYVRDGWCRDCGHVLAHSHGYTLESPRSIVSEIFSTRP